MHNNMNVAVGGPINADYPKVYKTKFLKPGIPFSLQVTEPDTKYVIKHDFVLDGDVTIPANCVLQFDGGSISGGSIIFNNTEIVSFNDNVFTNISIGGTLKGFINISWFTLINDYDIYNLTLLDALTTAANNGGANIMWNTSQIYILCDLSKHIHLKKGLNDFNNTKFYVKAANNVDDYGACVLTYSNTLTDLSETTIESCVASNVFKDKIGILVLEDETPIVPIRYGYGYSVKRADLVGVVDNRQLNEPILTYDDADTVLSAKYFIVDYDGIIVKNITFERASEGPAHGLIQIVNACNVTVSDITIITKQISNDIHLLDRQIAFSNCYNVTCKNIISDEEYGISSDYVITAGNVYNLIYDNVMAKGHWGITGGNNINRAFIKNSVINRFDCHCYGRDFAFENCELNNYTTQLSVHFGYVSYKNCSFSESTPVGVETSYNALTYYNIIIDSCVFRCKTQNKTYYIWNHGSYYNPSTRRNIIKDSYYPSLTIKDTSIQCVDNTILFTLLNDPLFNNSASYINACNILIQNVVQNNSDLIITKDSGFPDIICKVSNYINDEAENGYGFNYTNSTEYSHYCLRRSNITIENSKTGIDKLYKNIKGSSNGKTNKVLYKDCKLYTLTTHLSNFDIGMIGVSFEYCKIYYKARTGDNIFIGGVFKYCTIEGIGDSVSMTYSSLQKIILDHCLINNITWFFNKTETSKWNSFAQFKVLVTNSYIGPIGTQIVTADDISNLISTSYNVPLLEAMLSPSNMKYYINKSEVTAEQYYNRT